MTKTTSNEELALRIEKLVREHLTETQRVAESAVAQAFASSRVNTTKPRRAGAHKQRSSARRRTPDEIAALGERLYAAVCANPGQGMTTFAAELGANVRELHRPMTQLKKAGRLRSVGERHRTRYFPMAAAAE